MARQPIELDQNGLYILVSDMGSDLQYHWGLYLAKTPEEGEIFHVVNNITTNHEWQYQTKHSRNVKESVTLLVALKIAVVVPVLHEPLAERLGAVSTSPPITCRLWLMRALHDLDSGGLIKLKLVTSVEQIVAEASVLAMGNVMTRQRGVYKSDGSWA